jgi:hypothetical protein
VTRNMTGYKQCSYSLHKAIKQAKRQYRDKLVAIQRLRHKMYVAGSAVNHGLQKENQPCRGPGCLAPRQTKKLLCSLWGQYSATDTARYQNLRSLIHCSWHE